MQAFNTHGPSKLTDYLFPLSADPPHYGHFAVTEALRLKEGDRLTIAILENHAKAPGLFSMEERKDMCEDLWRGIPGVEVLTTSSPLTDLWRSLAKPQVVRGIRHPKDLEYETEQATLHNFVAPGFKDALIYVDTPQAHLRVASSSFVKGLVSQGIWAHALVPPSIERQLWYKIHQIDLWNITGRISSGKSTLASALKNCIEGHVLHINVDHIVFDVWNESSRHGAKLREQVARIDPEAVDNDQVVRATMRELSMAGKLQEFDLEQDVERLIRGRIMSARRRFQGHITVLIEWALIAEMNLSHWGLHQTILLTTQHPGNHSTAYKAACLSRQMPWEDAKVALERAHPDAEVYLYTGQEPMGLWLDILNQG